MNWIGIDRIMFSSATTRTGTSTIRSSSLPPSLTDEQRRMIYAGNARALYRLD